MGYDNDFETIRPVFGAFSVPVWVCAPQESVAQASLLDLCAIWAIFRAVWAARPVYQADTKCWASRDEPVEV